MEEGLIIIKVLQCGFVPSIRGSKKLTAAARFASWVGVMALLPSFSAGYTTLSQFIEVGVRLKFRLRVNFLKREEIKKTSPARKAQILRAAEGRAGAT